MFYYPVISAVVGTSLNMTFLSLVILLSWFRFFSGPDEDEDEGYDEVRESDKDMIRREERQQEAVAAAAVAVDDVKDDSSSTNGSSVFELSPDSVEVLEEDEQQDDEEEEMKVTKRKLAAL